MKTQKRNGNGRRIMALDKNAVVKTLCLDEVNYLTSPNAGPGEICLAQKNTPAIPATVLLHGLGTDIHGLSPKDVQLYRVPNAREVWAAVRRERDRLITSHTRNGRVRNLKSGQFVRTDSFEMAVKTCNRVMAAVRSSARN